VPNAVVWVELISVSSFVSVHVTAFKGLPVCSTPLKNPTHIGVAWLGASVWVQYSVLPLPVPGQPLVFVFHAASSEPEMAYVSPSAPIKSDPGSYPLLSQFKADNFFPPCVDGPSNDAATTMQSQSAGIVIDPCDPLCEVPAEKPVPLMNSTAILEP